MTGNRRLFVLSALCIALTATSAFAGGGGSKRNSTIRIKNDGSTPVGVAVGLTNAQLSTIAAASDPIAAWTAAGGKVLNAGATADFKVREGTHRVVTAFDPADGLVDDEQVLVGRGQIRLVPVNAAGMLVL